MTFDLRRLVREVHDTTDITDHVEMADAVIERLPANQRKDALRVALAEYCRWACTSFRSNTPIAAPSTKSWKRAGIQSMWERRLRERYATADGVKLLADCTVDDLVFMADQLDRQAAEKQAKARGWRGLANWMRSNGLSHVRDVPAGVLAANLGAAA